MAKKSKAKPAASDDGLTLHTTFRLPRELHDRLTEASGDKGIGDEIRRRLEASFESEANSQARDLTMPIAEVAALVREFFGDWQKDAFAYAVLMNAIEAILRQIKPPAGEAKLKFNPDSIADLIFTHMRSPNEMGVTVAGMALHKLGKEWRSS